MLNFEDSVGRRSLFRVTYVQDDGNDGHPAYTYRVGLYSCEDKAQAAIELLVSTGRFTNDPGEFNLQKVFLDQTMWEEGFVSFDEMDEYWGVSDK